MNIEVSVGLRKPTKDVKIPGATLGELMSPRLITPHCKSSVNGYWY